MGVSDEAVNAIEVAMLHSASVPRICRIKVQRSTSALFLPRFRFGDHAKALDIHPTFVVHGLLMQLETRVNAGRPESRINASHPVCFLRSGWGTGQFPKPVGSRRRHTFTQCLALIVHRCALSQPVLIVAAVVPLLGGWWPHGSHQACLLL